MNEKVHISEFYPCSEVKLAAELQYIVELGKYLYIGYGKSLSINGVLLGDRLYKSKYWDYFRMAVESGWIVDYSDKLQNVEIDSQFPIDYERGKKVRNVYIVFDEVPFNRAEFDKRNSDLDYNYRTPVKTRVAFKQMTDDAWYWGLFGANTGSDYSDNNNAFNSENSDSVWVSLLAFVAVNRLFTSVPKKLLIEVSSNLTLVPSVLSNLLTLGEESLCTKGWMSYAFDETISDERINNLIYQSWYSKGQELGLLERWYSDKEKRAYIAELDMQVGDVVHFYERNKEQTQNRMKSISGFKLAIIRGMDKGKIMLELINSKKTLCQGDLDYQGYTMAAKELYGFTNPFHKYNASLTTFNWADLGIEYMMCSEHCFITPCYDDDKIPMHVTNGEKTVFLKLSSNDLSYWILKDYKVKFNEERFLDRYFPSRLPVYTEFNEHGTYPMELVIREE